MSVNSDYPSTVQLSSRLLWRDGAVSVVNEITEAKRRATMEWLRDGAKDSLHKRQVRARQDVAVNALQERRLELLGPIAPPLRQSAHAQRVAKR